MATTSIFLLLQPPGAALCGDVEIYEAPRVTPSLMSVFPSPMPLGIQICTIPVYALQNANGETKVDTRRAYKNVPIVQTPRKVIICSSSQRFAPRSSHECAAILSRGVASRTAVAARRLDIRLPTERDLLPDLDDPSRL